MRKEEDYISQIHICRSEKNNEQQTIRTQVDNGVRHNVCLCLRVFFLVGEASLFLLKCSKLHLSNAKRLQDWSGLVLPDLKNPAKETTCKTDAPSSQKRSNNVSTSKASLHQTDYGLAFLHHNYALNECPLASNRPGLYSIGVGFTSPTSSKNLASKNAQYPPKMEEIH